MPDLQLATPMLAAAALLAALALARPAAAQELPPDVLEKRVRLELFPLPRTVEGHADPQLLRGTVLAVSPDSVHLQLHDGTAPLAIANTAIAHVDLSRGIRTEIESGLEGAGNGALVGMLQWGAFNGLRSDPAFNQSFAQSVVAGAIVGALVGGVIGALRPQERWERLR